MSFDLYSFGEHALGFADPAPPAIVTFYQSTHGYTSTVSDDPPSAHFESRVLEPFRYKRSLFGGSGLGGLVTQGFGEILLDNADGFYDTLLQSYAIDGRDITVRLGEMGLPYAQFSPVLKASALGWTTDDMQVSIALRDRSVLLDRVLQTAFYGGTGGLDGGADLAGKPKPIALGFAENVTPAYLGIIDLGNGALQTYQVNWRAMNGVTAVREGGAAYTEITSGAPTVGQFKQDKTRGIFQIGGTPAFNITADVEGDAAAGYITATSDIVQRLLTDFSAALTADDLDAQSLAAFHADAPGGIGYYIGTEPANIGTVIDALMAGVGGWGGFNREGRFEARILKAPAAPAKATFASAELKGAPQRLAPSELPSEFALPIHRCQVGYRANWTVQTTGLAADIPDDIKQFVTQKFRVTIAEDNAVQTRNLLAGDPPMVQSYFSSKADADALAQRIFGLFSGMFAFYRVTVRTNFFALDLGDTATLQYPRFGLASGRNCLIVDLDLDGANNTATYILFDPGT